MPVRDIHRHIYGLRFANRFRTAHGAIPVREGAIIELTTADGVSGIGELAPLPQFGGGDLIEALDSLRQLCLAVEGTSLHEALDRVRVGVEQYNSSAIYGLETALLDALGKTTGKAAAELLATHEAKPRSAVTVNAMISDREQEAAVEAARAAVQAGFSCVKLKVGLFQRERGEIERIAVVREALGPAIKLRLDANEAWSFEQAVSLLRQCSGFDIEYVEQPLRRNDLEGMSALRKRVTIPIAADESVRDMESARQVLENEAAEVLIVKPQLAGGLSASQRIIEAATARGMQSVITTTLEAGVGVAAALHLAAATPAITQACGLATLDLLADDLISDAPLLQCGELVVPQRPGLGVSLDRNALKRYVVVG